MTRPPDRGMPVGLMLFLAALVGLALWLVFGYGLHELWDYSRHQLDPFLKGPTPTP